MNKVSVSRGGTCSRKMLCRVGLGNDNPQHVRGDKIHENELLSDTVELALTYKSYIKRGSGECVISSK